MASFDLLTSPFFCHPADFARDQSWLLGKTTYCLNHYATAASWNSNKRSHDTYYSKPAPCHTALWSKQSHIMNCSQHTTFTLCRLRYYMKTITHKMLH